MRPTTTMPRGGTTRPEAHDPAHPHVIDDRDHATASPWSRSTPPSYRACAAVAAELRGRILGGEDRMRYACARSRDLAARGHSRRERIATIDRELRARAMQPLPLRDVAAIDAWASPGIGGAP